MTATTSQAIDAALRSDWNSAIHTNKEILEGDPDNIDALNRLAYALSKSGNISQSIETYEQILKKDAYNPIAKKNLDKIRHLSIKPGENNKHSETSPISPSLFLTDTQKTKTIKLINIAAREALQLVCIGEEIQVAKRGFELQVKSNDGTYLGSFPDDIGHTFMKLLERGRKISVFIKDIQDNSVIVFAKY